MTRPMLNGLIAAAVMLAAAALIKYAENTHLIGPDGAAHLLWTGDNDPEIKTLVRNVRRCRVAEATDRRDLRARRQITRSGKAPFIDKALGNDVEPRLRGGCAATGGIGYPVHMISLHGSDLSAQGLVANVSVVSNTFESGYVKGAVAIWSGTQRISVADNTIRDAGLNLPVTPNTALGRYAILIYNSAYVGAQDLPGLHPDTISINGNVITNPYSCGVYVARGQNIEITGNRISGQRDRDDVSLPKGAIALNHADNVRALNNELTGNYIAISAPGSTKVSAEARLRCSPGFAHAIVRATRCTL